ncbi:metalloregulator ArsR/SmtB family transcription factor [Longimicrobium sp.]|jgi:DNA-binding transcriptional ArsR family regulator|uniref:ArsR/SmtB family transcription factor n=1 Tax=Longimicrobium sp. TaxID=2029185 RepID=UPI002F935EF1
MAAALTEQERDRLAELFGVLGDRTRIRIAWALSEKELCVKDLATLLEMNQPAVSRALKEMRLLRIVAARHERQFVYYRLNEGHIRSLLAEAYEHARSIA